MESAQAIQLVENLMRQGATVVPIALGTKGGYTKGWKDRPLPPVGDPELYKLLADKNRALLLGGALADVDLDAKDPQLVRIAKTLLPETPFRWGRKGNPESHWLYRAENADSRKFFEAMKTPSEKSGKMIIELRTGSCLSVLPGSIHESGELIELTDPAVDPNIVLPAEADWGDLHRRVTLIALCYGAVETYQACGQRDTMAYCLAGILCRHGFDQELVRTMLTMLARVAQDEEGHKRGAKVDAIWAQAEQDGSTSKLPGYTMLGDIAGSDFRAWFRKNVRQAAPVGSSLTPDLTDAADYLVDEWGDDLVYRPLPQDTWFKWVDTHWEKVEAKTRNYGVLEPLAKRALREVGLKMSRSSLIGEVLDVARSEVVKPMYMAKPGLLNFSEGTWDVAENALHPHCKEDGQTSVLSYMPLAGKCPKIDRFLLQTIPDVEAIYAFEEFVGLALLGDRKMQKSLILYGRGGSGKSTLGHLASLVCGEDPDEQPTAVLFTDGANGLLSRVTWNNMRLAHISEFPAEAFQAGGELFKAMASHNSVPMRQHYKEESHANRWNPKLLLTCNELPRFLDPGGAIERRLLVIECPYTVAKPIPGFRDRLREEIPQWAVRCMQRAWRVQDAGSFTISAKMEATLHRLVTEGDPIQGFAHERLIAQEGAFVLKESLYINFKQYLDSIGKNRIQQSRLLTGLQTVFPNIYEDRPRWQGARPRCIMGIRFRTEADWDEDPDQGPQGSGPAPQEPGPQDLDLWTGWTNSKTGLVHFRSNIFEPVYSGSGPENTGFGPISPNSDKTHIDLGGESGMIHEEEAMGDVKAIQGITAKPANPVHHLDAAGLHQRKTPAKTPQNVGPKMDQPLVHPVHPVQNEGFLAPEEPKKKGYVKKGGPKAASAKRVTPAEGPLPGQGLFDFEGPSALQDYHGTVDPVNSTVGDVVPGQAFGAIETPPAFQDYHGPANDVNSTAEDGPLPSEVKTPSAFPEYHVPEWVVNSTVLALDTETAMAEGTTYGKDNNTALDPHQGRLRLVTLSDGPHTEVIDTWQYPDALPTLRPYIEDPARVIVAHNAAFDIKWLLKAGYDIGTNWACTMLMSKVLDGGLHHENGYHKLSTLAHRLLGVTMDKSEQASDWSLPLTEDQLQYAALDSQVLITLYHTLEEALQTEDLWSTAQVENQAVSAVATMEYHGLPITRERWATLADAALDVVEHTRPKLQALLGSINLNSHVQLKAALAKLNIFVDSTDKEHLHDALLRVQLSEKDDPDTKKQLEVLRLLKDYKDSQKQATTYGHDWLNKFVNPTTGRVHAHFSQIGADTGRFSCAAPNVQNLPRGDYRKAFTAPEGQALVKSDYAAIELRIAAALAQDPIMLKAFNNSEDLHTRTAALLLQKPEAEITKAERQIAKSANFGLLYGSGVDTLRSYAATTFNVDMSTEEARKYRTAWFYAYPAIKQWQLATTSYVRQGTGVGDEDIWISDNAPKDSRTMLGRIRRRVPTFTQKLNSPVQGTGADGLKAAMAALHADRHQFPDAHLVGCVHDELVFQCPLDQAPLVAEWVKHHMVAAMTQVVQAKVLIEVDATICRDWSGAEFEEAVA